MRGQRLLIGAAALLICAELGLRWGAGLGDPPRVTRDPDIEYRLIPSMHYKRFGNRITINRYGMRGPDHAPQAAAQERRVLLIGDSVVYGNHFLDDDDIISAQLTKQLQSKPRLEGCVARVMAAAASSWGPVNQAAFLTKTGLLDTDIAVLIVSAHDLYDTPTTNDTVIPYRLRRSYGALDDAAQAVLERLHRRWSPAEQTAPPEVRQLQTRAALDDIWRQMRASEVPLILAYHPIVPERRNGLRRDHDDFKEWAQARDVPFIVLENDDLSDPAAYRDHIHPTAAGATAIAGFLAPLVTKELDPCP